MSTVNEVQYEGHGELALRALLKAPRVIVRASVGSTLDVAHDVAAHDAPGGTVIVADRQTAGRGRGGKSWASEAGSGVWMSYVGRPLDPDAFAVLSLRTGIALAALLEPLSREPIELKWPNDIFLNNEKLAGIIVEARWRNSIPDWVVIGIGVNLLRPESVPGATGLVAGTSRLDVLAACVEAARGAASAHGPLTTGELAAFAARDRAKGRECIEPRPGIVAGINADGALLVRNGDQVSVVRSGSLTLLDETAR